jgi:hypothetical protein
VAAVLAHSEAMASLARALAAPVARHRAVAGQPRPVQAFVGRPPVRYCVLIPAGPHPLLDHFVSGGQQRFRDGKAERLGGFEVKYRFVLCRHLYGHAAC